MMIRYLASFPFLSRLRCDCFADFVVLGDGRLRGRNHALLWMLRISLEIWIHEAGKQFTRRAICSMIHS